MRVMMQTDVAQKLNFDSSDSEEFNVSVSIDTSSCTRFGYDSGIGDSTFFGDLSTQSITCMDTTNNNQPVKSIDTSPCRRVRSLRLDSPTSPHVSSSVRNSPFSTPFLPRSRLFVNSERRCTTLPKTNDDKPSVNVNPFTPSGLLRASKKRSRSKRSLDGMPPVVTFPALNDSTDSNHEHNSDDGYSDDEVNQPTKKLLLHESNISRYHKEFHEICLIASGQFGSVFKCLNRLDGCVYAVKKSIKPIKGSVNEKHEVYAHAVLGKHPNVVRYFSAWAEEDHIIIQNEFCNLGSLADRIQPGSEPMTQRDVKTLLQHTAEGLRYIHSMKLVHMDIKPGNIFISQEQRTVMKTSESGDEDDADNILVYKIGDLGHVTSLCDPLVEEGDCRYLPEEILHEDYSHLTKADIFALGATLYEVGVGGGTLPKNGPRWHELRAGKLEYVARYSQEYNNLLKRMMSADPTQRPSAAEITQHRLLANKTCSQLRREIAAVKLKSEIQAKKMEEMARCLKQMPHPASGKMDTRANRLVGAKTHRSLSTNSF